MQTVINPRISPRSIPALAAAVLATAVAASACGIELMAQEEARDQWTRSYTIEPGATVEVLNTNGTITIKPGEGNTVEVVADRIAKAATEERAKAILPEIEIHETASADRVRLDSKISGMSLGVSRRVDYAITVPRWANVRLEATNGNIKVDGLSGEVRISATNGRIEATGLENGATVDTTNGAITLDFASLGDQGITCDTVNGAIAVAIPSDANADVTAQVTNGSISTGDLKIDARDETRRRVDGQLGSGGTRIRLETVNGAIRLRGR